MDLGAPLFSNIEPRIAKGWLGAGDYSPSKLTIALSDLSVIAWVALGANAIALAPQGDPLSGTCLVFGAPVGAPMWILRPVIIDRIGLFTPRLRYGTCTIETPVICMNSRPQGCRAFRGRTR